MALEGNRKAVVVEMISQLCDIIFDDEDDDIKESMQNDDPFANMQIGNCLW